MPHAREITRLLNRMSEGDVEAGEELLSLVYGELRSLAGGHMRRQAEGHTLQPTALVHEAYLKLAHAPADWRSREHFLAVAAKAMRQVLVDHARARRREKRGGGFERRPLDPLVVVHEDGGLDLVELDDALGRLAAESERAARVVELRFFGGLTGAEAARVLGVTQRTVERDWHAARAWLLAQLADPGGAAEEAEAP